jgi:hypothetical protein
MLQRVPFTDPNKTICVTENIMVSIGLLRMQLDDSMHKLTLILKEERMCRKRRKKERICVKE